MKKNDNLIIYKKDCEVLEVVGKKVLVKKDGEKFVAETNEKLNKQDRVNIIKTSKELTLLESFIYFIPVVLFLIGFGFGFIFKENLYHYLLVLGLTLIGFIIVLFIKLFLAKFKKNKYIEKKMSNNIVED